MSRVTRALAIVGTCAVLAGTIATNTALRRTPLVHAHYWVFALLVPLGVTVVVAGSLIHLIRGRRPLSARAAVALACVAGAALAAGWPAFGMGDGWSIDVAGGRRGYIVHLPPAASADTGDLPAVLLLHGFVQSPRGMRNLTDIERLADEAGFVVIYPKGTLRSWNDGDDTKPASKRNVDDLAFLAALVDSLPARHGVDPARVYAIGFSNGGFLLVRHACALAGPIAAFGIVAAGTYPVWDPDCRPGAPVPAAFILGAADPTLAPLNRRFEVAPDASAELWAHAYGCEDPDIGRAASDVGSASVIHTWRRCPDGFEVHQIVVRGAGHAWPGGPQFLPPFLAGETTDALDATGWLWDFFESTTAGRPR